MGHGRGFNMFQPIHESERLQKKDAMGYLVGFPWAQGFPSSNGLIRLVQAEYLGSSFNATLGSGHHETSRDITKYELLGSNNRFCVSCGKEPSGLKDISKAATGSDTKVTKVSRFWAKKAVS